MTNVLTTEEIVKLERGVPFQVPPGALITSAARDLARAREIELIEPDSGGLPPSPSTSSSAGLPDGAPPPSSYSRSTNQISSTQPRETAVPGGSGRRGPTPGLWRNLVRPEPEATPPAAAAPPPPELGLSALGPRETHLDGCYMGGGPCDRENMVVVTAVGRNRPRVLAELAAGIAELEGDIQEISQRIVGTHFHTILTVDTSRSKGDFMAFKQSLEKLSRPDDYQVHVQHEKVFKYMHRI
jgi:ACT domain-containing protein